MALDIQLLGLELLREEQHRPQGLTGNLQVADPFTFRSTPAPHAATLLLRPASVRLPRVQTRAHTEPDKQLTQDSQLGREGQAKEDHRYRPHAIPQDRQPQVQQRIPNRYPQGRQGPHRQLLVNESTL